MEPLESVVFVLRFLNTKQKTAATCQLIKTKQVLPHPGSIPACGPGAAARPRIIQYLLRARTDCFAVGGCAPRRVLSHPPPSAHWPRYFRLVLLSCLLQCAMYCPRSAHVHLLTVRGQAAPAAAARRPRSGRGVGRGRRCARWPPPPPTRQAPEESKAVESATLEAAGGLEHPMSTRGSGWALSWPASPWVRG